MRVTATTTTTKPSYPLLALLTFKFFFSQLFKGKSRCCCSVVTCSLATVCFCGTHTFFVFPCVRITCEREREELFKRKYIFTTRCLCVCVGCVRKERRKFIAAVRPPSRLGASASVRRVFSNLRHVIFVYLFLTHITRVAWTFFASIFHTFFLVDFFPPPLILPHFPDKLLFFCTLC